MGIQTIAKTIGHFATKNSSTILTGLGVAGLVTTTISAVEATLKALDIIAEERENKKIVTDDYTEYKAIPKLELIKLTWKCYAPTAGFGLITIGCMVGANRISLRRNAALAGLYSLSEKALKEYQAKVVETIGEKKERAVRDEIAKDRVLDNPVKDDEVVYTGKGDTLCYDALGGRYFRSDIEFIRRVINDLGQQLLTGYNRSVTLNDVYYELGLERVKIGEMLSWRVETGGIPKPHFSSQLTGKGTPCLVLDFEEMPVYYEGDIY